MTELRLTEMTRRATDLMMAAHAEQVDKAGLPYYYHPMRVATYVRMTSRWCGLDAQRAGLAVVACLLHDTTEDTWVNVGTLLSADLPDLVIDTVQGLHHHKEDDRYEYWKQIARFAERNPLVRPCKWADMIDNTDPLRLALLPPKKQDYLTEKYTEGAACLEFSPSPIEWWASQRLSAPNLVPG